MEIHRCTLKKRGLHTFIVITLIAVFTKVHAQPTAANPATASFPVSIGNQCGGGLSTWSAHVFQYNSLTTTLDYFEDCIPTLLGPGFGIYGAGISFNPADHKLYYYRYTGGNTYVWRWQPGSGCPPSTAVYQQYNNVAILGFAFAPDGLCYQLVFTGAGPYGLALRTVDFATGTFGPQRNIVLPAGTTITQQSGDLTLTPDGKMLMVWDKHYMTVNYEDYPTATPLEATLIADLTGDQIVGLCFSEGKVVISDEANLYWDLNILSGAKTAITQTPCYQSNDLTEVISGIGAAKKLSSATPTGTPGKYDLSYDITVKNLGGWDISNVQVVELLRSATALAGTPFTAIALNNISNVSVSWVYNPLGLALNPSYTGLSTANANLLAANQTLPNYPAANNYFVIRVSFTVTGIVTGQVYNNNARVKGTGYAGKSLEDISTDGDNPDLNNNSKPDDPGEDHPTPFVILTTAESPPCAALNKIIYNQTFGTGVGLTTAIPAATGTAGTAATDYTGSIIQPLAIENYALTNDAANGNTARWINLTDHTGGGRMMVVNADVKSNKVYSDQVNISCTNLKYSLFAFVSNIGNSSYGTFCDAFGGMINPKLIFTVRNAANGNIITNLTTPDITSPAWTQYGMKFVMPAGITKIIIEITNAAAGGCGNDLAIDDVQFGLCDPTPTVSVNNTAGCTNGTTVFSAALSDPTVISGSLDYQWQVSSDNITFTNIVSANNITYTINPLTVGDVGKYYRVIVAAAGSINDVNCRYVSSSFQLMAKTPSTGPTGISVSPLPTSCPGNAVTLTPTGGSLGTNAVWKWYRNSCGDTLIGTGNTITVFPSVTTTYYVRAEGDCDTTACAQVTITVISCVILPVDFLQFNAVQQTDFIDLNWKIITSQQLKYFEVERSIDGIHFSAIGKVAGDTHLNSVQAFHYTDEAIPINSSILYYRINAVSKDGAYKYSTILMIKLSGATSKKISINPNPASYAVSISLYSNQSGNVDFQLIDMTGKVVLKDQQYIQTGQNTFTICQLNRFSEGIYTILVLFHDRREHQRLVIRR